jgi:hypothetical protein
MKNWIYSIIGFGVFLFFLPHVNAADLSLGAIKGNASKPLIVDIDNPSFRKLTVAIPPFLIKPGVKVPEASSFATEGPAELARLLTFSGLFNIMLDAGYKDVFGDLCALGRK